MSNRMIHLALLNLRPGAAWSFDDSKTDLTGLTWLDEVQAAPTQEQIDAEISKLAIKDAIKINTDAVQAVMDAKARQLGYDNLLSACSYAAQPAGAPFQAEAAALVAWRSAVWAQAYSMLAEVEAQTRLMPTPEEAVAAMPALVLP